MSSFLQLIKDMVSIGESTNWFTRDSIQAKYRSLKCHIEHLHQGDEEFETIKDHVISSQTGYSTVQITFILFDWALNRGHH